MRKYKVGIIGATGMVGQRFVSLLENHPWFEISTLAASSRSSGKRYIDAVSDRWSMDADVPSRVGDLIVYDAVKDAKKIVSEVDFVFCAVDMKKEEVKNLEEMYAKLECPVISNNSANREMYDVPMIIPEINYNHMDIIKYQKIRLNTKRGFIAVKSNCSLQSYVPAIHPLMDLRVNKILACTYQAISGAGRTFKTWPEMVDNIIPFISGEEEKSEIEPLKIWGHIANGKIINADNISITSQCFRVPISDGHTAAVFASFDKKIDISDIIYRWENYKSEPQRLSLPSAPKKFLHYFSEENLPQIKLQRNLENGMAVSIGRLRKDSQYDIKFVCMSHNTIRGAAGGAILMAELLLAHGYMD